MYSSLRPSAVRVGRVERRDPHVPRGVEQPECLLARSSPCRRAPAPSRSRRSCRSRGRCARRRSRSARARAAPPRDRTRRRRPAVPDRSRRIGRRTPAVMDDAKLRSAAARGASRGGAVRRSRSSVANVCLAARQPAARAGSSSAGATGGSGSSSAPRRPSSSRCSAIGPQRLGLDHLRRELAIVLLGLLWARDDPRDHVRDRVADALAAERRAAARERGGRALHERPHVLARLLGARQRRPGEARAGRVAQAAGLPVPAGREPAARDARTGGRRSSTTSTSR